MTWGEIEKRVKAGGDPEQLWECLFRNTSEITELREFMKTAKGPNWLYPMFCMAAHTGMRRSEMVRARAEDLDFEAKVVTVREKKRTKGTRTTRRVPMTGFMEKLLREWVNNRPNAGFLFGKGERMLSMQATQELFRAAVDGSKWGVLHGFHTLRHSFCTALAVRGIDQRIIDESTR
jgi:integrase